MEKVNKDRRNLWSIVGLAHDDKKRSSRLGVNTYQVFTILVEAGNPLGIDRGHYRFAIAGWKTVCDDDFVEYQDVGVVIKASGTHPDPDREDG